MGRRVRALLWRHRPPGPSFRLRTLHRDLAAHFHAGIFPHGADIRAQWPGSLSDRAEGDEGPQKRSGAGAVYAARGEGAGGIRVLFRCKYLFSHIYSLLLLYSAALRH